MKKRRPQLGNDTEPAGAHGACSRGSGRSIRVCAKWSKPGATISTPQAACRALKAAGGADRESFYVIPLDVRNRSLGIEEVAKGHLTGVEVHPREVFKGAILSNAAHVIIAHNHPSGDPSPSPQDIELTKRLAEVGKLVGIPIRDHVIVAAEGCTSFRERYGGDAMGFEGARDGGRRRAQAAARAGLVAPSRAGVAVAVGLLLGAAALALAARS